MRLVPFDPSHAADVLSWAQTRVELASWASLEDPPAPAIFATWLGEPDVHGRLLVSDAVIAYGELWVCEEEHEVELARILVAPAHRNRGVGRTLVELLVGEAARFAVASAWVRVVPENSAAIRCYLAAGFASVSAQEEAALNAVQPREYRWLCRAMGTRPRRRVE
jgi:GNAT superfamily N-acetyltransferase